MARASQIKPVRGRRIPTTRVAGWMEPMLATLVESPVDSKGWLFERKLDGIRALAYREGDKLRLYSRNKLPLEQSYFEVVEALQRLPNKRFVVDGEVVAVVGRDAAGFEWLQQRHGKEIKIGYYIFDVLQIDGRDVRALPLRERKKLLSETFRFRGVLHRTSVRTGDAEKLRQKACEDGWEGLIAKRADSPYQGGRSRDWLKLKCVNEQELVIAGFTDPKGSRMGFGALLVGYYEDRELHFAGEVGTGFNHKMLAELAERLKPKEIEASPFADLPRAHKGQHFVRPELVAQIGFTEWTRDGKLRHPRFLGLRKDKRPQEVIRERPTR